MQDLQPQTEPGRLQVELAQSAALVQFIADEQILAIEAATDRLQVWINGQGLPVG